MKLFDLDGPFQHYGGMVFDLLAANLLWLFLTIFSAGILSGPATLALYQSIYQSTVLQEGYFFKEFLSSLKKRFFFQLAFCLLYFIFMALSLFNLYLTFTGRFGALWLLPVYFFIFMELSLFCTVALPLLSQNRNLRFFDLIKISFIIANKHLPWVFLCTLPGAAVVFVFIISFFGYIEYSFVLFFLPALSALLIGHVILKKVLAQYHYFEGFGEKNA